MSRHLAPAIVLLAALVPAMAHAQTDIDQGKTPAQIFANDCAVCHKAARGLANGRNSLTLTGFLREHYTASREQAAALAAYVLAGGGESGTAAQRRGQKPAEEPKPATRQARRPAKPEEEAPATAKLQRPTTGEEVNPEDQPTAVEKPGPAGSARRPVAGRRHLGSVRGPRGRPKPPEAVPAVGEPAAVVAVPGSPETPSRDASPTASPGPSAAAPTDAPLGEVSPVPRDDIPD